MADSLLDIALRFKIQDLQTVLSDFKKLTESATLSPQIRADKTLIALNLQEAIDLAMEQMKAGELDPSALGLNKIISNLETMARNYSKKYGQNLAESLKPLQDQAFVVNEDIEKLSKSLSDLEKQKGKLTPDAAIAAAKKETGFTGKAVAGGSLDEAEEQLSKLKKAEKAGAKTPGLKEKIEFYKELVKQYKNQEKTLDDINKKEKDATKALKEKKVIAEKLAVDIKNKSIENAAKETAFEKELNRIIANTVGVRKQALGVQKELTAARKAQNQAARDSIKKDKQETKGLGEKATAAFSYYLVFNQLKRVFSETLRTIRQLDHSMTEAAIVTSMNRKEAWALLGTYQDLARATGLATSEIAGVVTQFLRQGRSIADAMQLAEVAAKSAKVASISANDAVNYLTSAVNGFGLAAKDSEMIADKFAAIAARSASSFEELAIAMSKVAPTAKSAGVGVDFMMGVIAKGIETTREAPENIGTAFKTIFARMREVTDMGKAMEDGMSLNRVEKALQSVGVALRDPMGQFRNLEQVLIDVGEKWQNLTSVEQAYLATALAGSRQQPRLLAIFNDFARTKELIQISAEATGELANQHYEYMQGSEAALTNLRTSWEQLTMAFVDTELVVFLIQQLAATLKSFGDIFSGVADAGSYFRIILIGIGVALSGLATKFLQNLTLLGLQFLATALNATAQKELGRSVKMTAKEFQKLTAQEKLKIITDLQTATSTTTVIAALKAKAIAAGKATLAFIKLMIAMWPLLAIAAGIAAVVAIVAYTMNESGKNAEYFAGKVAETNKNLSELATKERDLKKLIDRFETLRSKAVLTAAEFDELNNIAAQLSEYEFDGRTFNLTRTEVTGKIIINTAEYNKLLELMNIERQKFLKQNLATLQEAMTRDLEGALDDDILMSVAERIGYDFGLNFIESFGLSIDENMQSVLKNAAGRAAEAFRGSFTRTIYTVGADLFGFFDAQEDGITQYFDSIEEAREYMRSEGYDPNIFGYLIREEGTGFDSEGLEAFIEEMLSLIKNVFDGISSDIALINEEMEEGIDRTAAIFENGANAYAEAEQHLRDTIDDPKLLEQAIQFLGESMYDQKVLDDLINERKIDAKVIARLSVDLSLTDIDELFKKFEEEFSQLNDRPGTPIWDQGALKDDLSGIFDVLFNNTAAGVQEGMAGIERMVDMLVAEGTMTIEEGKKMILMVANQVKTLSLEQVAAMLKEQMDLSKKIFDLPNQISKGDFSSYVDLIENYGLEATKRILSGDAELLKDFFDQQNQRAIDQIDESIQKIRSTALALDRDLSDAEQQQIEALLLMKAYYEDVASQEQLRNFRLTEAKNILKEMNDLISLQSKLIDLGVDGTILDIFSSMVDDYYKDGLGFLITQMEEDLQALDQFMGEDGYFDPDELGAADAAINKSLETFGQLIDAVTAAYNRQKKEIEDRYKTEIDAIKTANSERWSQIDFTNKLAEAEEKIIDARRRLMGFALSGVSRGTLEQAQKDLKKLQEERQKIIEQQMVDEATKQLELDMQSDLIEVQQELTSVLDRLILEMEKYRNVFMENEGFPGSTGGGPITREFVMHPMAQASMDQIAVTNTNLVDVNNRLITSVDRLARVMGYVEPVANSSGGAGRGQLEDFDVTATIGITRM